MTSEQRLRRHWHVAFLGLLCLLSSTLITDPSQVLAQGRVLQLATTGGTGTETIAREPAGTALGGDKYEYPPGTEVTLRAVDTYPEAGSLFKGWSGDAAGAAYEITLVMDRDRSVTATFNWTFTLFLDRAGTGLSTATVTAGTGSDPAKFPGGSGPGTYLYESGDTILLTATDSQPDAGSRFVNWTLAGGDPGPTFDGTERMTSVTMTGDLGIVANFVGTWKITAAARPGGDITPSGARTGDYGQEQTYTIQADPGYVNTDVVVDGISQGPLGSYTFTNIIGNHDITAHFIEGLEPYVGPRAGDDLLYQTEAPPLVLLVMGRNHKLYYEAYNDASDLNGDGSLDTGYNPDIDYYGYFDSYKAYTYNPTLERFEPTSAAPDKKVNGPGEWSGDFLNYLTTSRMDALRKVLYGGSRSTDTSTDTVLQRVYIPQDAHTWGKEYESVERDGYDIREYTPLDLPEPGARHLFASTTLEDPSNPGHPDLDRPLLRVLPNNIHRIWEWVAKERPVADDSLEQAGATPTHPGHPTDHAAFEKLVEDYGVEANLQCSSPASKIYDDRNPCGGSGENFLIIFKGHIRVDKKGFYRFAVDGDDAVEVLIDGSVRAGWYGAHSDCKGCTSHRSGRIYLRAGLHSVEFRHEQGAGASSYRLYWRGRDSGGRWEVIPEGSFEGLSQSTYTLLTPSVPESRITDYEVRVLVCDPDVGLEDNCRQYPSGVYKPTGILQDYGESGRMYFGLLTGSYTKNTSGGVLRKRIGPITDEINQDTGQLLTPPGGGIIDTINRFRISEFRYSDYSYQPGWPGAWVTTRPMDEGEFPDWGNPVAEMMYEGMRYLAGKGTPSRSFTYGTSGFLDDNRLGLPKPDWDNPYSDENYCAKPFMLVLSDIYPTYDSDQLPGSFFGSAPAPDDLADLDAGDLADRIFQEEGEAGTHYMGQVGSTDDDSCLPKEMSGFGNARGLCPEEPTKQGSYYAAGVAYYGRTGDINPVAGEQNVLSYMVGLASPLPHINIRVGTGDITLVPFAKSVGGGGISPNQGAFQPTNTIVDFFVEDITPTYGRFRINYEDVEQGADHDMDAIVIYEYQVIDNNGDPVSDPADGTRVRITLSSDSAAGGIIQHMGYIISGTTADGTYLEVRDCDTEGGHCRQYTSEDVDYFLDTPPGVTPPASRAEWEDGEKLPLTATRTFEPGITGTATLLKNPFWYAAKWGAFDDINGNQVPDLEGEWDEDADGEPDTYFHVVNPLKLEQQLNRSFSDILSRGSSHVAPVVSVDEANRAQSGEDLYMAFFRPMAGSCWRGNLKKYGLDYLARTDCGRTEQEWTVVDKNGTIAGLCDGTFKPTSTSFWSSTSDGGDVDKGGAGERLLNAMPGADPIRVPGSGPYLDFRNIKTSKAGSLVDFTPGNITNADLDVTTDLMRFKIINFLYGYTFDADETTGKPTGKREWILGDIIHSEPRIVDYLDENGNTLRRYVAVGSNDGMLHVFTDQEIPSQGYSAGDEVFAFVPGDLLPRLKEFADPGTHLYMVDGPVSLFRSPTFNDANGNGERDPAEYFTKTLVFGERRGGRSYWALDVTDPDPENWSVKWHIRGGSGGTPGFEELGYTWSKPFFASIRTADNTTRTVAVFGGGYDPLEDGYPEAFDDADKDGRYYGGETYTDVNGNGVYDTGEPYSDDNLNGVRDPAEFHSVTIGGSGGYDRWNPGKDTMGRGIFVVDAEDGSLLFKATYGDADSDGDETEDITTGTDQRYAMMKYAFPADLSVIPLCETKLVIYAADLYAQVWKVVYDYQADTARAFGDPRSTRWVVKRIFASNPGSTLQSGSTDTDSASLDPSDGGRKAFYSPDVSFAGNEWSPGPVLYFGTGDRAHPRYTMISNRFYAIRDLDRFTDESALLNLTCDELDLDADPDGDGDHDSDDELLQKALKDLLLQGKAQGFYRTLDKQSECPNEAFDHTGEHVLSQPTLFFKNLFFTSYQPTLGNPCNPAGNALIYALDFSWGTSALNFFTENDVPERQIRTIQDTYRVMGGSSIPSGIRVMMRGEKAAGLVSAGGKMTGAGEEGSTEIPGPPGGVSQMLWLTQD
ncbi:MAG: hypothetical protein JRJ31_11665 [Deltaproteobacteria bacterium]|nr:hypothetical protein [Deltaproteobacteria bacterium]